MCIRNFFWRLLGQSQEDDTEHQKPLQIHEALEWIMRHMNFIESKIDDLSRKVGREARADKERDENMSAETKAAFAELQAEVASNTDATSSMVAVVDNLVAALEEADGDPVATRAITAQLKTNRDALVAATLKGTPADPIATA